MPIVKKTNKTAVPTATKKTVAAPAKKVVNEVKEVETPVAEKKTANKGGKKLSLTGNTKTPKTFEIKEGSQATQEAFID